MIETFDGKQLGLDENKVILVSDYKDIGRFYLNKKDMEKYEITLQTMNKPHERELFVSPENYLGVKKVNKDEYLTDNYVNLFEIVKNDNYNTKMIKSGTKCIEIVNDRIKATNACDFENMYQQFKINKM